jgi:hypothetical protein
MIVGILHEDQCVFMSLVFLVVLVVSVAYKLRLERELTV